MSLLPWWETNPERLEWELESLGYRGLVFNEKQRNKATGTLELEVIFPWKGRGLRLKVLFPCFYPDTRPEVYTADLKLKRHQHPYNNGLCLLGQRSDLWDPRDSLAKYLQERIPIVITAAESDDPEVSANLEEQNPDPATRYLTYDQRSIVLIPDDVSVGAARSGTFELRGSVAKLLDESIYLRGVLTKLGAFSTKHPPDQIISNWALKNKITGRFFRLKGFAPGLTASEFIKLATTEHPQIANQGSAFKFAGFRVEVLAFLVPEEHGYKIDGESWFFIINACSARPGAAPKVSYVRANKFGRTELTKRVPELRKLSDKTVAIFGLGCVGAPIAMELARAGVKKLHLLDHDIVEAGTTVRWPLGIPAVGELKSHTLMGLIVHNYPHVDVLAFVGRIGAVEGQCSLTPSDYDKYLEGVDLIIDATADVGISFLIGRLATALNIPSVVASSTNGGWGGLILQIIPGETGCFDCAMLQMSDGNIDTPPESERELITVPGCAEPTFTAASFDVQEVSLAAARSAASILVQNEAEGYRGKMGLAAVLTLRDKDGRVIFPQWKTFPIERHTRCEMHK